MITTLMSSFVEEMLKIANNWSLAGKEALHMINPHVLANEASHIPSMGNIHKVMAQGDTLQAAARATEASRSEALNQAMQAGHFDPNKHSVGHFLRTGAIQDAAPLQTSARDATKATAVARHPTTAAGNDMTNPGIRPLSQRGPAPAQAAKPLSPAAARIKSMLPAAAVGGVGLGAGYEAAQ